jgi:hypothetical protein
MSDGSALGIPAKQAMKAVLGGDQPTEEDIQTPERVRERVMAAPLESSVEGFDYNAATDSIARAMLTLHEEGVIDLNGEPPLYTEEDFEPSQREFFKGLIGSPKSADTVAWEAITKRWPFISDIGASGFMVGFAFNTARWLAGFNPVGNPAIMEISI